VEQVSSRWYAAAGLGINFSDNCVDIKVTRPWASRPSWTSCRRRRQFESTMSWLRRSPNAADRTGSQSQYHTITGATTPGRSESKPSSIPAFCRCHADAPRARDLNQRADAASESFDPAYSRLQNSLLCTKRR
jgi:hypothetical protein